MDPPRGTSQRIVMATIVALDKGESCTSVVLEKVQSDTRRQEKLKAASDANAASAIAKEAGFSISADEFTKAQSTELSDEELEGVAGGGGRTWGGVAVCTLWCLMRTADA